MPKSASLRLITTAAAAAVLALSAAGQALAAPTARTVHPAAAPGRTGGNLTLDNNAEFSGYDAAIDPSGNTYIGWISDKGTGRKVHLCTIPINATKCMGGVQTIDSLGDSSAEGLKVLVSSAAEVTLVWFHDTTASTMGPQGGEIATATSAAGGPLNGPFDMASAPSFGSLLDARLGPGNAVWTVAAPPAGKSGIQVHDDIVTPGEPGDRAQDPVPGPGRPAPLPRQRRRDRDPEGRRDYPARRLRLQPGRQVDRVPQAGEDLDLGLDPRPGRHLVRDQAGHLREQRRATTRSRGAGPGTPSLIRP